MRREFTQAKTAKQAKVECPWAAKVVRVEGGYICFESVTDWRVWKGQK